MKHTEQKIFVLVTFLVINFFCLAIFQPAQGSEENLIFKDKTSYDIYLEGSEERLNVIKEVYILRVEEIYGKTFLVVRPAGFTLDPSEGFILFDSIRAVLPHHKMRVQISEKFGARP